MEPIVSVVIPTYSRSQLVKRAVISALAQTLHNIEVIVVIDGLDPATCAALAQIKDSRMKVIELPTNQGCRAARKAGIDAATGKWIASLDDDDQWMPQKLELQLKVAESSQHKFPIVTCYLVARSPKSDAILPRRLPKPSEAISDYLFVRNTLFQGEGLIQSSTIFTSKELLQKVPILVNSQRHDDWDWLLRASSVEGVGVEFVPDILSIWYVGDPRPSLSKNNPWRASLDWIRAKRDLVTPRAYSSFILAEVSARAAKARDWNALLPLLWEAVRFGKPQLKDILLYLGMWFISPEQRNSLRHLLAKKVKAMST